MTERIAASGEINELAKEKTGERPRFQRVLVTGGAGYVGSVLTPQMLQRGYRVRVLDLYIYGDTVLDAVKDHPGLEQVKADLRDEEAVRRCVRGCDAVIHLACISNDPSVELDPELSRSINYEAFKSLLAVCAEQGVRRFIFASSGSVYGVTSDPDVTEEHELAPITLYNQYKAMCEELLFGPTDYGFAAVAVRPATIYGCSPRQRLDLTVNILTTHAVNRDTITVFGGTQMRPNIHMQDMVDLYLLLLEAEDEAIAGQVFNAAYDNYSVAETAEIVRAAVRREMPEKADLRIVRTPSDDIRSYHLCSEKVRRVLGFAPQRGIETGVRDLVQAFRAGRIPNPLDDVRYYNIRMMKHLRMR